MADAGNLRPSTQRLMEYWSHGKGALKIRWGTGGDYDRCLKELGEHVRPEMLHGLCANLHHRATGTWPGKSRGEGGK